MSPSRADARTMIAAAIAHGRAEGMNPLSVLILDAGGAPIAFEREDNSPPGRYAIVWGKANACIQMGLDGTVLAEKQASNPGFWQTLPHLFHGGFVANPGGVLIRDDSGKIVGAVGVSGCTAENDRKAAIAGITAAGYKTTA